MPGAYLATNLITSSITITPDTEDENYPAEYLYDKQSPRVFRCESPSSLSILLDFGAAISADTIALINHNLTSGASLSLKGDNSNPPTTGRGSLSYRANDLWAGFTLASGRYWLLEITDTNSEDLEIGQLILGQRTAFPRARRIGRYRPAVERSTIEQETYAGMKWNYHKFDRKTFNPSFRVATAAELEVLRSMDAALYGNLWPFLWIPDTSGADCYYVRKEQEFSPEEIERLAGGHLAHDYQMTLTEETRGLDIQE